MKIEVVRANDTSQIDAIERVEHRPESSRATRDRRATRKRWREARARRHANGGRDPDHSFDPALLAIVVTIFTGLPTLAAVSASWVAFALLAVIVAVLTVVVMRADARSGRTRRFMGPGPSAVPAAVLEIGPPIPARTPHGGIRREIVLFTRRGRIKTLTAPVEVQVVVGDVGVAHRVGRRLVEFEVTHRVEVEPAA